MLWYAVVNFHPIIVSLFRFFYGLLYDGNCLRNVSRALIICTASMMDQNTANEKKITNIPQLVHSGVREQWN